MTDVPNLDESTTTVLSSNLQRENVPVRISLTECNNIVFEPLGNGGPIRQVKVNDESKDNVEPPNEKVEVEPKEENEERSTEIESEVAIDCTRPESRNENLIRLHGEFGKENETQNPKSGSSFTPILSLFQVLKLGSDSGKYKKNNKTRVNEVISSVPYHKISLQAGLGCFALGGSDGRNEGTSSIDNNLPVPYTSLKPEHESSPFTGSKNEEASGVILEQISPIKSILNEESSSKTVLSPFGFSNIPKSPEVNLQKMNLISEGDILICYVHHCKSIFSKVLTMKCRQWESHHIHLGDDSITSETPKGVMASPLSYSDIEDIYDFHKGVQRTKLYLRLTFNKGYIMMQACNSFIRDQWVSSILWKKKVYNCKMILLNTDRPEIILREIKNLIISVHVSHFQYDIIVSGPFEIISNALLQKKIWDDCKGREMVIIALAPLLERTTPSPDMFKFFSDHCLLYPRSSVMLDVFTSVVQRILQGVFDFVELTPMLKFATDFMTALYSQNGGDEAINRFILSLHGRNSKRQHLRVVKNLVAVSLAAILTIFEKKGIMRNEASNAENCYIALQQLNSHLSCYIAVFRAMSEYEDWRPDLGLLLRPIPFSDDALSNEFFLDGLAPVIKRIGTDIRCEVHSMILDVHSTIPGEKGGWLKVYSPTGLVCKDEGELWCRMLRTLISCCCRRKRFLQKLMQHLGALILVSLKGKEVAHEILCLMLEWHIIYREDQEELVITALNSTETGRNKYAELNNRQELLRQMQEKRGPRKLTLPRLSNDAGLARLLSMGPFVNLECLNLAFTHVTSSCAQHLINLLALRCLNLWATRFGDAGLILIGEHLVKIEVLNLCETRVTDKGISAIVGMRNLKKLNLNSTKLSLLTLKALKRNLPVLQELDIRYTDAW